MSADLRRAPDADCIAVDSSLMDSIANRPAAEPLEPITAVAVHDPWIRSRGSMPYEHYYVIAMEFQKPDGSNVDGIWGMGTNLPLVEGQAVTVVPGGPSLVSVDDTARQNTVWPDIEMFFPEDANAVKEARRCLSYAS
ncbi:hypothetical protein [Rhodococcus gannanensis]|uniref:Uncharacterized protein n=1 Tax=Rhodococcus gannanensis TaxID=1960308 RepID=A0ABW4P733_9NOCA